MTKLWKRFGLIGVALFILLPAPAQAQVWVTPFAGVGTSSGESGATVGASIAAGGAVAGELDVSYASSGLLEIPLIVDIDTSMTTLMGNLLVRVPTGDVQPYGSGGIGLMRVGLSADVPIGGLQLASVHRNELAWNVGGGAVFFLGDRMGIRGDVRYFRTFDQSLDLADVTDFDSLPLPGFDFWRVTGGLTMRF